MRAIARFSLPLLAKELTEQSARGRTFLIRAIYAALLYSVTLWGFYQQIGTSAGAFGMLGTGHLLFQQVLTFQAFAVFALLPLLTAGVLTSEKERDTLGILLITRLGPWTIILEKFFSRVIPMLLYLLLSLPLMAVAYSLGGVESGSVFGAATVLVGLVLHVGSVGVFASAYCRTTTQALMLTYVLLVLLVVLYRAAILPFMLLGGTSPSSTGTAPGMRWFNIIVAIYIGYLPAVIWLFLARLYLWRRAFLQPRNRWLQLLRWFDGFFHRINQNRVTKGIVLLDEKVELPLFQPIAWRETRKRSLGTVRYLVRFLLLVEGPLLFGLLVPLSDHTFWSARNYWPVEFAAFAVWWVTVFAVLSLSTALVAGERSRQSLDVLLSTPMSAERIVSEKFSGVRRMITVLWIPLATVFLFRGWWHMTVSQPWRFSAGLFLIQSVGAAVVYPPLLGWLGFHCSLRFKSQVTAMTAALGVVLVLGGLPWALDWVGVFRREVDFGGTWTMIASIILPATGPNTAPTISNAQFARGMAYGSFHDRISALMPVLLVIHFGLYTVLWQFLRWLAPRQFIRHTGRCEQLESASLAALREPQRRGFALNRS